MESVGCKHTDSVTLPYSHLISQLSDFPHSQGAGEEIPPNSVLEFDMELVSFEKKASKEKKQKKNKKNKLPEGALHLFINLHNTSAFLCVVIVRSN